nr:hypothetical protein Iba_chr09fCG5860 [Ipomoea batatas]GME21122.1 hypothetical protein Iba_scaffold26862CG0030 [Ipomoea batatas]
MAPNGSRTLPLKNPPAPFPASTTIWNPSRGFSEKPAALRTVATRFDA